MTVNDVLMQNKPKMAEETRIPQQKHYESKPFPAVISAIPLPAPSLPLFTQTRKPYLDSLLHESGAVLFRGFPVNSAVEFNDVVEAFGFDELPYVGGAAPRTSVVGRVFTANESPPDQKIPFHHEMAQVCSNEYSSQMEFEIDWILIDDASS